LINKTFKQLNAERAARRTEYEECQDQNNPGWKEIHKYNKKLQAASALKQTQLNVLTTAEYKKLERKFKK
jgi:hypothetical protein